MAAEDLLVFVHIEKCAGTAVNTWLQLSHHMGNLYVRGSNIEVTALRWGDINPVDLDDVKLRSISSHHLRTYPKTVRSRTLHYMTLLRNPIARWISYVRFFRKLVPQEAQPQLSLREYAEWMLEQPLERTLAQRNGQMNFLAEHEWYRRNYQETIAIDWTAQPDAFERYLQERFALALELIRDFDVVGIVEDIDGFTRLLQARAPAWDLPLIAIDGLNPTHVTEGPPVDTSWITMDDSVGRKLFAAFAEDFELHQRASDRLVADLARLP
jgi:hypothetical protein